MTSEQRTSKLDCLALKDRIQSEVQDEIGKMSPKEELEAYEKGAEQGPLAALWQHLRHRQEQTASATPAAPKRDSR